MQNENEYRNPLFDSTSSPGQMTDEERMMQDRPIRAWLVAPDDTRKPIPEKETPTWEYLDRSVIDGLFKWSHNYLRYKQETHIYLEVCPLGKDDTAQRKETRMTVATMDITLIGGRYRAIFDMPWFIFY